ncbi:DUF262 domain-containing protein [Pseudomonas aeruginosa]|uniref:DUF262 domain-containing protein n=1 Tax=Pseudomonas aeruginosa TaxID=287 RepID=UPI00163C4405|nr:DUF262 domain-containing protein [Pseudomonas aeruginosa]
MQITFDRKTVNTCLQQNFILPTYQRDYKWEVKHMQELMTDIQESFLSSWEEKHGRKDVLGYEQYFLGTIITTQVDQGGKAIVDGQQRITTLTLILAYIHRLQKSKPNLEISPVDQSIRRKVAGQNEFNLDMDKPRQEFFTLLIDGTEDEDELNAAVDSINHKDSGTERLWELYQEIDKSLAAEITERNLLAHFFDYLTECVCMFEIGVPREQDGHKVFVTMNDRGLKLSPIDLLKGFLLSSISTNEDNKASHASWNASINKLKQLGSDEDSNFFKTWLRSKFANTSRGKKRGDAPGDFELVGDSYHRWVIDNKERLDLKNSDDYTNLLTGTLPFYVDLYCKIKTHERQYSESFPHVFYNGARDLTLQSMLIMSASKSSDTSSEINKKIRSISYFLDYLAVIRALNGKENTYDNIRDLVFEITKEIRDLDSNTLKQKLAARIDSEKDRVSAIKNASYHQMKRQDLLHVLARIGEFLEKSLELTNKVGFEVYVNRSRDSKTFDIEHLIPYDIAAVNAELAKAGGIPFDGAADFYSYRNNIGALILLPRGRNRSMKAMPYKEKLQRYSNENVLAQTLCNTFYLNQPNLDRFKAETNIELSHIDFMDAESITKRAAAYLSIAEKIWSKEKLETIFNS